MRTVVLTNNRGRAFDWMITMINENHALGKIDRVSLSHHFITLQNGDTYRMCANEQDLMGIEFDKIIISPFYEDLRMIAERRMNRAPIKSISDM